MSGNSEEVPWRGYPMDVLDNVSSTRDGDVPCKWVTPTWDIVHTYGRGPIVIVLIMHVEKERVKCRSSLTYIYRVTRVTRVTVLVCISVCAVTRIP